jgi:hypothetical protein
MQLSASPSEIITPLNPLLSFLLGESAWVRKEGERRSLGALFASSQLHHDSVSIASNCFKSKLCPEGAR